MATTGCPSASVARSATLAPPTDPLRRPSQAGGSRRPLRSLLDRNGQRRTGDRRVSDGGVQNLGWFALEQDDDAILLALVEDLRRLLHAVARPDAQVLVDVNLHPTHHVTGSSPA